tara:strand:+ start:1626 stop:2003 length:378 start_codon:yes stop_codon:yes gene_type:complete
MLLAAFEPGSEMAIANFFLAIFCLFTIALPLLLITRGGKTEANRDFIAATINPWSQIGKEIELTPVLISTITSTNEVQPELEVISENNYDPISESEEVISIDRKSSELEESAPQVLATNDELLAA